MRSIATNPSRAVARDSLRVLAMLAALSGCANGSPTTLSDFEWLLGDWAARDGAVIESWRRVSDATFEGIGVSRSPDGELVETLRLLAMGDAVFFLAKVPENPLAVAFRLTADSTADRAVFANPDHDFPRRIVYEKTADGLLVTVSDGADNGFQLRFRPADPDGTR